MFELADRLVGIYKTNDHTKSITISPKMFAFSKAETETDGNEKENRRVPLGDATNRMY
jgi:hypothetical protein